MRECRIVIKDEVNVKLEGLELDARRSLVNKFKYEFKQGCRQVRYQQH